MRNIVTRLLRRGVDVRDDEVAALLLSCAYFFFILASYYILRPIRDEVAVASGVRTLPFMYTGTLILSLLVHPPFAALVARLPRTRFISYTYRFFMSNLLIFFLLLKLAPESANIWIGRAFYWWVSVFNLFVVSVFWAFMADVFRSDQGKRLFGFIAVGGTLGAILGAGTTAVLAEVIGPVHLILISVLLIEIAVQCVRQLSQRVTFVPASEKSVPDNTQRTADERIGGGILTGIAQVIRSPYLLGICGYMLLYTIVSTFLYSQQTWIVEETIFDRAVRTSFFAKIDVAVNVLTLLTQIFLTGRLIKLLGVAVTLSILPAVCMLGFTGLGLWPFLGVLLVFQTLRRAGNYGIARPTREILYTVVSREEKYKAKNFIDVFVYRGGDQVGVWAYGAMVWLGVSMSATAFVAVPICAVWLLVGYALGRRQETLARRQARSAAAVVAAPAVS